MEAMHNQEPKPEIGLEQRLARIAYEGQMLQFAPTGFRLYQYMETGETVMRSIKAGESEHVFRVPVREPVLQKEAETIEGLFGEEDERVRYNPAAGEIEDEEYQIWKESLLKPEDLTAAADKELERREAEGDEETIACGNCRGKMHFEINCSCTHGGTTFMDLTDESETVKLREEGEPDPDCETCEGTGKYTNDCPCCQGSGLSTKYPQILLINEVTGEERLLKLDLAALVASGEIGMEVREHQSVYTDFKAGNIILDLKLSDYIDRHIAAMGIDKENAVVASEYGVSKIPSQKDLSRAHAWSSGRSRDENGLLEPERWVMRPIRSFNETLEDLKISLAERGYTLGFSHTFIATGETGPSFFILDEHGQALQQISNDYDVRESLENAWLAVQKLSSK
jgi:hypothetical protein